MANRRKLTIGGITGAALSGMWSVYSALTTASQLPTDAGWFARMIADPPIYAPWLLFAICILVVAMVLWKASDEPRAGDEPERVEPPAGSDERRFIGMMVSDNANASGNTVTFGNVTHQYRHQDQRTAPPAIISAFAGPTARQVMVRVWPVSQSAEARTFINDVVGKLTDFGIDAQPIGVVMNQPAFRGIRISGSPHRDAQQVARTIVELFAAHGMKIEMEPPNKSVVPFVKITVGDNG